MTNIVPVVVVLALLLLTLSVALSFLSGPLAVLRKSGVLRAAKRVVRTGLRGLAGTARLLMRHRRPRIRRPAGSPTMRRVG